MIPEHPDTHSNHQAIKQITRGGNQAADDMAMEAMWQALDNGASKEEAGEIFIKTYQKSLKDGNVSIYNDKLRG